MGTRNYSVTGCGSGIAGEFISARGKAEPAAVPRAAASSSARPASHSAQMAERPPARTERKSPRLIELKSSTLVKRPRGEEPDAAASPATVQRRRTARDEAPCESGGLLAVHGEVPREGGLVDGVPRVGQLVYGAPGSTSNLPCPADYSLGLVVGHEDYDRNMKVVWTGLSTPPPRRSARGMSSAGACAQVGGGTAYPTR